MVEDNIAACVRAHYAKEGAPLLLLSGLGVQLSKAAVWPAPGDTRSLHEAVSAAPGIAVVQDPDAKSFIAVVLEGEEQRASDAIAARRRLSFLRGLPRPVILAFTIDVDPGETMQLRLVPRPSYLVAAGPVQEGYIPVDEEFRTPGVNPKSLATLNPAEADALEANIRAWLERHRVDTAALSMPRPSRPETMAAKWHDVDANALDRLLAAQEPDVARRMTVPLDIAVTLSRLP